MKNYKTLTAVALFAIAFGFIEAATVVYLRHLLGSASSLIGQSDLLFLIPGIAFLEPETAIKIIKDSAILNVELIREAATLIMLVSVAAIAGRKLQEKAAYFFFAFGVWDVFYYVFLKVTIGWPSRLTDLDTFFLLPAPWVGPVYVPVIISFVLIVGSLKYLTIKEKK